MLLRISSILVLLLFLANCAKKSTSIQLEKSSFSQLKNWSNDNHKEALLTFRKSCSRDKKVPNAAIFTNVSNHIVLNEWKRVCKLGKQDINSKKFFEENFIPYLVRNKIKNTDIGLFTGYYEVELEGSVIRTNKYKHPVYLHSNKVNTKIPRSKIEQGALKGKKLEVAYVADKVGLFFMHTQGSGKIRISDDSYVKLGYAGQNGHPYFHIGSYLTKNKLIDPNTASAESIIKWLNDNPHKAAKVMNLNESYIFFRVRKEHHPVGAMGVEVTPMRTLAVDRSLIPLGMPLWLETSYPREDKKLPLKPFHRIMVAQDVGGAIKGPIRGDIFFGSDKRSERYAWHMANRGRYFVLVPKGIAGHL
jgi:membrane-bound lytic murein transglycosylase A